MAPRFIMGTGIPHPSPSPVSENPFAGGDPSSIDKGPEVSVTYKRRAKIPQRESEGNLQGAITKVEKEEAKSGKVLNKKRNYAQFHLEFGLSDFLLHTCTICRFRYAKGDEADDKFHRIFHKNYTHGIPFKVWEVVEMMEMELGDGRIFHQHCMVLSNLDFNFVLRFGMLFDIHCISVFPILQPFHVYMFVSSGWIIGCLVAEPIKKPYRILSSPRREPLYHQNGKEGKEYSVVLQFGEYLEILQEQDAVPASCGIRTIWVARSNRRKHIAGYVLDAVRGSFSNDPFLDCSKLAFYLPTSVGMTDMQLYWRKFILGVHNHLIVE
ncbi:hypothetical protein ACH5RR_005685 [Cinchona calisaya]|uniref:Uncharacterized protein n=1 Tax=Cinchona calisaya TaxID=153742 RepID=A0ABD3ALV8_9GENT